MQEQCTLLAQLCTSTQLGITCFQEQICWPQQVAAATAISNKAKQLMQTVPAMEFITAAGVASYEQPARRVVSAAATAHPGSDSHYDTAVANMLLSAAALLRRPSCLTLLRPQGV
jgi:hypothetical protein